MAYGLFNNYRTFTKKLRKTIDNKCSNGYNDMACWKQHPREKIVGA